MQRINREWHFHLYDAHNRPVISGFILTNHSPGSIRNSFNAYNGAAFETWSSGGQLYGYSNQSFPVAYRPNMAAIRSLNWYDNYDFKQLSLIGNNYNLPPIPPGGTITPAVLSTIKGMVTGSLEKVDDMPGIELVTVNYYDVRRRLLCAVSDNHLGGRNNVFIGYTFNDEIREKIETHYINGQPNDQIVLLTRYTYDHQGRLLEEKLKFGDEDFVTISALEYIEIGDVLNTYLHGGDNVQAFNQKIKNTYNIRGWLRKLNDPAEIGHNLFALDLRYENPTTSGAIATTGRFNGNISQMLWNSKTDMPRAYGFSYDPLNRLTGARYGDGPGSGNNQNHFRTDFDYDANGNITYLQRNMDNTLIDDLGYTYYSNSNRLQSVFDASGNTAGYVPNTGQYLYDANGNMTYDPSKKITVSYNPLNLPRLVEFDNDDNITYTYTATGTKLRKTVTSWKTTTGGTTDYAGQFLYQDNELSCIFTPVGRIVPMQINDETFWKHEYNLKDHLGNTRIVFAAHPHGQPEVMQQTSYYPFGMTMQQQNFGGALNQPNKLLYNGKELQDDELAGVSLDWYDYGARFYDPILGRFSSVDPLTEDFPSWTPYHYVHNNPIVLIDPTGMSATKYEDEEGNLLLETNDGSDDVVKVSDDKVDQYKKHAELYEVEGMAEVYDSQGWNDNAKMDLLELESSDELNSLDNVSSQFARQKLIDYYQDDRSVSSWVEFLMAEVASQNANPLNHIPAPINIKGPKLKLRSNSNLKPTVAKSTPKKVNPWHKFRSEMRKGTFTKEKYGSTEAAKKAKNEAYKKWKEENGY